MENILHHSRCTVSLFVKEGYERRKGGRLPEGRDMEAKEVKNGTSEKKSG